MNFRVFVYTVTLCTPIGWIWGLIHCQMGEYSAWVFPMDAYFGIEFCGMILEDWSFYPLTGGLFVTMIMLDPLNIVLRLNYKFLHTETAKHIFYYSMVFLFIFGLVMFGTSGRVTTVFFLLPSLITFLYIWDEWDIRLFIRTGFIVVPVEFLWDHWAVGRHQQWIYLPQSKMFGDMWFNGIPIEMTPFLGIAAWYFIFGVVKTLEKRYNEKV